MSLRRQRSSRGHRHSTARAIANALQVTKNAPAVAVVVITGANGARANEANGVSIATRSWRVAFPLTWCVASMHALSVAFFAAYDPIIQHVIRHVG